VVPPVRAVVAGPPRGPAPPVHHPSTDTEEHS
jgi:hypothetical protein